MHGDKLDAEFVFNLVVSFPTLSSKKFRTTVKIDAVSIIEAKYKLIEEFTNGNLGLDTTDVKIKGVKMNGYPVDFRKTDWSPFFKVDW